MKKKDLEKRSQTDWVRLNAMRDEDINFSDRPELGDAFFRDAVLRLPPPKAKVCIRLDQDILEWFKAQGKGYQTRINAVLRAFKESRHS
jgi:uncharacterized protein (DUF4415 family)